MAIVIKDCSFENCGTGIKTEGKIDIRANALTFKNNNRDIDMSVTEDSIVELERIFAQGTKLESINIKEYKRSLTDIRQDILENFKMSAQDKEYVLSKIEQIESTQDSGLIVQVLNEIKRTVKSIPSAVVVGVIVRGIQLAVFGK